ncbi:MAG TPA: response regulator [Nitrososphaeraceae archaeon]
MHKPNCEPKSKGTGKANYGIDLFKGKIADLSTRDIYEPLTVKNQQNPIGYDFVLSDIRMPGISGLDLIRRMKNINSDVKFALMSAFETDNFQSELKELELSRFMKKPMHIDQLISAVKECLANSTKVSHTEKLR